MGVEVGQEEERQWHSVPAHIRQNDINVLLR